MPTSRNLIAIVVPCIPPPIIVQCVIKLLQNVIITIYNNIKLSFSKQKIEAL